MVITVSIIAVSTRDELADLSLGQPPASFARLVGPSAISTTATIEKVKVSPHFAQQGSFTVRSFGLIS